MSRPKPTGFFDGASNFEIRGGTFNEVAGDLNQYYTTHQAVQHNIISGNYTRYNSPTIVNFGQSPPPPPLHRNPPPLTYPSFNRGNPSPLGPTRGAARADIHAAGLRMEPYPTAHGYDYKQQSPPQSPSFRSNRALGRGGSGAYSPSDKNPSSDRGTGVYPRFRHHPNQQSGSGTGSASRRSQDPWAYIPAPQTARPPSPPRGPYRGPKAAEEDLTSDGDSSKVDEETDEESDTSSLTDVPSDGLVAPHGLNRAKQRRKSF
ncbi:hypothetical protein C8R46DRAFT_1076688 [Mycena filopes]|nr:hypothetical protein C8R46DRAFT_1076688 [Mycena filopes]